MKWKAAALLFKSVVAWAMLSGSQVHAAQDGIAGEKLFRSQCMACHSAEPGAAHRQGANLFGVIGRGAGQAGGATYSSAFKQAMEGKVWTEALLDKWLEDPQEVAPDSMMMYSQADPEKRQALIDYLKTLR